MSDKKKLQLGMNPSTASGRLVKDILWSSIVQLGQNYCYHCGEEMTRETFSIEHKVPWLDSENPTNLYFDLENITFSHLRCNTERSRKPHKKYKDTHERRRESFRRYWEKLGVEGQQKRRRENYLRNGC